MKVARTSFALAATVASFICLNHAASNQRTEWNRPIAPFHIIGNVYFVGTHGLGVYLITTPKGHILLDGALPESAPQIERNVTTLGFKLTEVRYLLNSHAHYDHAGGLFALKQASGAQMVASRADAPDLESGLTESFGAGWDQHDRGVKVDRTIDDGETVSLGGTTLTAHVTPGHTRGCTTWSLPVQESGRTYQVVFYCSTSVPGYPLLNNRLYPAIVSDYRHSFQVLRSLPCDVFLTNHTGFFHMDEKLAARKPGTPNPFVRPGELAAYADQSQQEFEQELAKQTAAAQVAKTRHRPSR